MSSADVFRVSKSITTNNIAFHRPVPGIKVAYLYAETQKYAHMEKSLYLQAVLRKNAVILYLFQLGLQNMQTREHQKESNPVPS